MRRWLQRRPKNSTSDDPPAASTTASASTTAASPRKTFPSGIKLLYSGENSVADIIFVHGLTGDREKTWTAENTAAPWPQTLLPSKIPNARVLTFGYDANVVDWRGMVSKNRIGNHAMNLLTAVATYREDNDTNELPIIFVCHSLGGLVCEDALSTARQRPERHLQNILHYTRGIVFVGTPHHGSGLAQWAERLAIAIGLLKQTNPQIVAVLERDSEVLARVQDSFHTMIRSRTQEGLPLIEITCFYEELPLLGVGVVVPSYSAILPGYVPIGMRSNHMDMTKFEHADDPGFTAIAGELRRWVKALGVPSNAEVTRATTSQQQQVEQQQSAKFIVPYTSNPGFVGRANILEKIKKNLCYGQYSKATSQARAAIFGLGGIGKTQIALAYAYQIQVDFPEVSIFWVHASNVERFHQAFSQIAQSCQIPGHDDPKADILKLVKAWLERKDQRPWLMVIDNADDTEMFFSSGEAAPQNPDDSNRLPSEGHLARYLPECPHGSILITTRNKQTGIKLTRGRGVVEVQQMDQVESSQLIHNRFEGEDLEPDHISLLAARLDNLPLALVQAAAFIQENSLTVIKYLQLLDQSDNTLVELLSQPFEEEGRDSSIPNAVTTTWMVSFEQIKQQCPHASDLLSLMSFFDRQGIPKTFLSHRIDQKDRQADYQQEQEDPLELEKALGILKAFSFVVEGRDNENLNMHRLIRLVMRRWLIKNGQFGEWAGKALSTMSECYPYGSYENQKICENYLPHAYAVLSYQGPSSTTDTIAKASLLFCTAGLMTCRGHWNKAEELQLQAVEIRKRVLGQEHSDTLTSMSNLALTYWNQGRWKEAEELAVKVIEIRKRVLGQEHPDTLTSMSNLALTYQYQGRWKEAEELGVKVIEIKKRVLGQERPETLTSMNNLASTYWNQGRWKEAEELGVKVIEIRKRVLGQEHPDTLTSMSNLASTYWSQGRWKEAEELGIEVIEIRKRVLGQEHPNTLTSMNNLTSTYWNQRRWKEAEELGVKVIEITKRVLGQEHPNTLIGMNNLASTYRIQGRWKEAEELGVKVIEIRKRVLGQEHPDTLNSMNNLASMYRNQGRWKEAEELEALL